MKKLTPSQKFIFLGFTIFIVWIILFISAILRKSVSDYEGNIIAKGEFAIQILTLFFFFKEYRKVDKNNKLFFFYLLLINSWLLIVDIFFFIATYFSDTYLHNLSYLQFIFYYVPCILYAVFSIIFFINLIVNNIIEYDNFKYRLFILIAVSLLIFSLYFIAIKSAYNIYSFKNILQIVLLLAEFILFDICVLSIIYANNITIILLLIGFIILISGDFLITYQYINQKISYSLILGEYLWGLGIIFLFFVVLSIKIYSTHDIKTWFRKDNSIKSRVGFYIYVISLVSYLIVYGFGYLLKIIGYEFFVLFPIITMFYSIIVVCLSIFIGKAFEEPFILLKNNINIFTNQNKKLLPLKESTISEFKYLQKYILDILDKNEKYYQTQVEISNLSMQAAHNLKSPLLTINAIIEKGIYNSNSSELLKVALKKIQIITENLVNSYRTLTDKTNKAEKNIENINIKMLIDDLIINKQIEWQDNPCHIKLEIQLLNPLWLFKSSYSDLYNVLSNLLNNAYESLYNLNRNIIIKIFQENDVLEISLKDNGCGMTEQQKLKIVNSHKSFKHEGEGLGISTAKKFATLNNGSFKILSELNLGTEVIMQFKKF